MTDRVEQVTYPDGVHATEVLDDLLTVCDSTGGVVWAGQLEDPDDPVEAA